MYRKTDIVTAEKGKKMILIDADDRTRTSTAVNPPPYSPARDFVEVVRCKDCKHNILKEEDHNTLCDLGMELHQKYDFCSMGERKKDG